MKNRNVGFLVSGIALIMAIIVYIFNVGLKRIVGDTCTHGPTCSMFDTIAVQTWISLAITGLVLLIGIYLIFSKEEVIIKKIKQRPKKKKISLKGLDKDEKKVIKRLQEENGAIFQAALKEEMEIGKVKMTRMIDKLEAKQLVERKRRGMNNIIVLKD